MTRLLPAVVVGGYLGAGKTTLVNRLLRHAGGRRIAVLVNDFGDVPIDADLIESRDGDVLNLAGGCICCSVGSDLLGALLTLPGRVPPPDLLLIETSGVALPGAVARSARLAPGIEVDGIVVLADAETVRERAADRYVGDTVGAQLRDADLLVLNKTDLVTAQALADTRGWLAGAAPRARVLEAVEADVPPEVVLGLAEAPAAVHALQRHGTGLFAGDRSARRSGLRARPATERFASATLALRPDTDVDALLAALLDPAFGVVRAKGIVVDPAGRATGVQTVGARGRTHSAPVNPGAPNRLVVIGLRDALDCVGLAARIGAAIEPPATRAPGQGPAITK